MTRKPEPAPAEDKPKPRGECVVLSGGRSSDGLHAIAGGHSWDGERKERVADFIDRAKRAAKALGERPVIIRGLKW